MPGALERIRDPAARETLRKCMKDPTFYAVPECFRAPVAIGDREAVPLDKRANTQKERGTAMVHSWRTGTIN